MANYEQFLKSSLSKYKNPDVARRDVLNVFTSFSDLRPKLDDFVFNDGRSQNLLQLDGTIPVSYKGNTYNIPVCIWLMDSHPYNPPMVYVKPTSNMQIKSGRNVDMNGKVDLPYLREWRYPNSDLLGMIQILTIVFGEEPPVYSRAQQPPQQQQRFQTPYPSAGGGFPMPMPGVQNSYPQNTPPYPQSSMGGYPQSNQYPGQYTGYPSQPSSGYPGYPSGYPSATASSYPNTTPGYPPPYSQSSYPSQPSSGYPGYPSGYPSATASSYPNTTPGYPPPYSQSSASSYPTTSTTASSTMSGTNTVTEEHLKASLLSAVEDKMKRRLKETFAQAQAEMDVLVKTQNDLLQGKNKLEQMITDLEKEKTEIDSNIEMLKQKDSEVKETLSRLENQEQLTIDEAVVTTAPLYRQLFKAFAEEQAIEDAIYYLGEALRKDVIDLDVFLKQVRELSRKQFMLRALIRKCREKAGLKALT